MSKKVPVLTIDTGVPVPEVVSYPFRQLKVGQSFLAPLEKRASIQSQASRLARTSDLQFVVRKVSSDSIRVWRSK